MDNTIEFIKRLKGDSFVEINNLKTIINYKQAIGEPNIYFCCGLGEKINRRCKDDDIKTKKYFVIDLDIRLLHYEKTGEILTQKQIRDELVNIHELIYGTPFDKYCAIVDSGNGIHLYYSGKERWFDKQTYYDGVSYIYGMMNSILKQTNYKCDPVCANLARIMRLPGTKNKRLKLKKDIVLWDLGDIDCEIIDFQERDSDLFDNIENYANKQKEMREKEKELRQEIKKIVKDNHKTENIWKDINNLPIGDIAEDVWGVKIKDNGLECIALDEGHKNMGAYIYKPENIIVNKGSSLIKTKDKLTFTCYELVYYELMGRDGKSTVEYFKDKYGIKSEDNYKKENVIDIPKRQYENIGYVYPNSAFDEFDCFMSGELVTIVAESNSGKTTFAMDIIQANADRGRRGFYINLEYNIRTMWESRWLYLNNKTKRNLTDIDPLSSADRAFMDSYVDKKLKQFDYYNDPNGMELKELVDLIIQKNNEGCGLFVVDTFSRIHGNLDATIARTSQNKAMETLHSLVQGLGVAILLLHHTNRKGTFEGTQKIMDLSNVFIMMTKEVDADGEQYRTFSLSKDKYVTSKNLDVYYVNQTYSKTPIIIQDKPF